MANLGISLQARQTLPDPDRELARRAVAEADKSKVEDQYQQFKADLDKLRPGQVFKAPTGRLYERGSDGVLYYNSQGSHDKTFGRLVNGKDPDPADAMFVRLENGQFLSTSARVAGMSMNATFFVTDDNARVFDQLGKEIQPNAKGVYSIKNFKMGDKWVDHVQLIGADWKNVGNPDSPRVSDFSIDRREKAVAEPVGVAMPNPEGTLEAGKPAKWQLGLQSGVGWQKLGFNNPPAELKLGPITGVDASKAIKLATDEWRLDFMSKVASGVCDQGYVMLDKDKIPVSVTFTREDTKLLGTPKVIPYKE